MSNAIDNEAAGRIQDALSFSIGMVIPEDPSIDQLAGALTLFIDNAIEISLRISGDWISDEQGKEIRKKVYRVITEEIKRHAVNSD